jgi:hypothetical protein
LKCKLVGTGSWRAPGVLKAVRDNIASSKHSAAVHVYGFGMACSEFTHLCDFLWRSLLGRLWAGFERRPDLFLVTWAFGNTNSQSFG